MVADGIGRLNFFLLALKKLAKIIDVQLISEHTWLPMLLENALKNFANNVRRTSPIILVVRSNSDQKWSLIIIYRRPIMFKTSRGQFCDDQFIQILWSPIYKYPTDLFF